MTAIIPEKPSILTGKPEWDEEWRIAERIETPKRKKLNANQALNVAVRLGRVTRQPCEVCGSVKVQAHHDDYSRPLDVRWLCTSHHHKLHAEEDNWK